MHFANIYWAPTMCTTSTEIEGNALYNHGIPVQAGRKPDTEAIHVYVLWQLPVEIFSV